MDEHEIRQAFERLMRLRFKEKAAEDGPLRERDVDTYIPSAPAEMRIADPAPEDHIEQAIREFRNAPFDILEVNPEYRDVANVTVSLKAVKKDFLDSEYLGEPAVILTRLPVNEVAHLGRQVIPMIASGFTEQGAAAIFTLAYHLRDPRHMEVRYVFKTEDCPVHVADIPPNDFSTRQMINCMQHETLPVTSDEDSEASAYAFLAASLLRTCTKSAENYIKAYNHILSGYKKFYGRRCLANPPQPHLEAIKSVSTYLRSNSKMRMTLYRLLYMGGGTDTALEMRRFLYEIHLTNTGMHILSIFLKLCDVLNCSTEFMLTLLNTTQNHRQVDALISMMQVMKKNDDDHKRTMWRYGRLFDDAFMSPLQTKTCPMLVYTLASALRNEASSSNEDILNIVQLQDLSPALRRGCDENGRELVRLVRMSNDKSSPN